MVMLDRADEEDVVAMMEDTTIGIHVYSDEFTLDVCSKAFDCTSWRGLT